jgi:hypothetical protein
MSPDMVLALPAALWIFVSIAAIAGVVVFYALHSKGDVSAEFSHGATSFRLEAKDRNIPGATSVKRSKPWNNLPRR